MKKTIFKQSELKQGSQEWLNLRKNHIGASEIPVLMGDIPKIWRTPYDILKLKMGGEPEEPSEAMKRGTLLEDQARNAVIQYYKNCKKTKSNPFCQNCLDFTTVDFKEEINFEQFTAKSIKFDKLLASFDGIDVKNKLFLEIKCPGEKNFRKYIKKQEIAKTYKSQTQTQCKIASENWDINRGIFANYFPEGVYVENKTTGKTNLIRLILIDIFPDNKYQEEIEKVAKNFYKMMEDGLWNANWKENVNKI